MFVTNTAFPPATEYQATAVAINTKAELRAAQAAGAEIQYTAFLSDPVDASRSGLDAEGWIVWRWEHDPARHSKPGEYGKLRAFYPVDRHQQYMATAAAQRDEE